MASKLSPARSHPKRGPSGCIDQTPTKASIWLSGLCINLSAISRLQGLNKSYLSRLFSGERCNPSLDVMKKISAATGISLDGIARGLEDRWAAIHEGLVESEIRYYTRVIAEDEADLVKLKKGKPALPRLAGLRL